jgi:hypothetical protein
MGFSFSLHLIERGACVPLIRLRLQLEGHNIGSTRLPSTAIDE